MSDYADLVVLVEGPTEQRFVKQLLTPYLAEKRVYPIPVILHKPGQKGGDVKFSRARNDIERHLKQRADTWITLLVDYYGIKPDWPGYDECKRLTDHQQKWQVMCKATAETVQSLFPAQNPQERFIPYVSMHETEALYFSEPDCLAEHLGVNRRQIDTILEECGEPEKINDRPDTAPSKRLQQLSRRFKKTTTGIAIAEQIGIDNMRQACPLFDSWVGKMETLAGGSHGAA